MNNKMAKLILPADAPREEWLSVRNTGLGGSDAGAVLGLNPYKSAVTLWAEKIGETEPDDLSDNEAVMWGTILEDPVARYFADVTGKKVRRKGTLRDMDHPWMLANVDRWIPEENAGLEIKTASAYSASKWDGDEIPDSYYAQCLHYMAVTGADAWYIAALIGGQKFVMKKIPRIEEDIGMLRLQEKVFWNCVEEKRMPPDIDGSDSTAKTLSKLYKGMGGYAVELPTETSAILDRYDSLIEREKELAEEKQEIKNRLMAMMGEAETATCDGRKITWKAGKPRETVSLSDIKKKDPASYDALKAAGLVKLSAPSRAFRIW